MKQTNTKKIIFLAFLLSLLFHVSSLVYVAIEPSFTKASTDDQKNELLQQKINKQQDNEWVEAKARAGNLGTPVFFQDEFEPQSVEAQQDGQTDHKPEVIETKQEAIPEKKEQTEETITEKENPILVQPQPTSTAMKDSQPKPTVHKKHIPLVTQKPQNTKTQQLSSPKPPLTLAQLSQGFLNHVKDEGKHAIHMLGKKNGTPSDEQIKYERYLQKLSWCLQNSFNIHNDRFPAAARDVDSVQVLLALNKDGSLKHCRISKTSGNIDLDYFTLFIFNDASTSFPPVPQYLPHDPFTINYIIMVSSSEESRLKLYRR